MLGRLSRILVADESEASRTATHQCLQKLGYNQIDYVPDGTSAVRLIAQRSYSLVLAEWETPKVHGADILRHVRQDYRWRGLPFLMVIPQWQRKFIEIVREDGAVLYLTRPFTADVLNARMLQVDHDAAQLIQRAKPTTDLRRPSPEISELWRSLRPDAHSG